MREPVKVESTINMLVKWEICTIQYTCKRCKNHYAIFAPHPVLFPRCVCGFLYFNYIYYVLMIASIIFLLLLLLLYMCLCERRKGLEIDLFSRYFYFASFFHLAIQTDADGSHSIDLNRFFRNRANAIQILCRTLLIVAMMMVKVVAVKFVEIAARCVAIVATGKATIIGCKTNCGGWKLCCIAAGCSPTYGMVWYVCWCLVLVVVVLISRISFSSQEFKKEKQRTRNKWRDREREIRTNMNQIWNLNLITYEMIFDFIRKAINCANRAIEYPRLRIHTLTHSNFISF